MIADDSRLPESLLEGKTKEGKDDWGEKVKGDAVVTVDARERERKRRHRIGRRESLDNHLAHPPHRKVVITAAIVVRTRAARCLIWNNNSNNNNVSSCRL